MRCPGVLPAGVVWQSGVSLVDLMPTILEAARVVPAIRGGEIHGRSLLPDLRAGRDRWRGPILMQNIPQRGIDGSYYDERALRTERWKLILRKFDARPELRPGELYDLQADPEENRNLYGSNRAAVRELAGALPCAYGAKATTTTCPWSWPAGPAASLNPPVLRDLFHRLKRLGEEHGRGKSKECGQVLDVPAA